MSVASLLVNTCTVTTYSEGQSSTTAGLTTTAASTTSGVACNIQAASGKEILEAGRETSERVWRVYFLNTATIGLRDTLSSFTGGSVAGLSGLTLEVISKVLDHAGRGAYQMVLATEAQV